MSFFGRDGNNKIILDTIYNITLTSANFFSGLFLKDEIHRLVYSSNEDAFYQRSEDLARSRALSGSPQVSGLDFPFANYKITSLDASELNWNHSNYVRGYYDCDLLGMIRFRPIKIAYEGTFWTNNLNDAHIGYTNLLWEEDNTTLLKPTFRVANEDLDISKNLSLYAYLSINSTFNQQYDFGDYREQGDIHNFTFDFELETVQIYTNFDVSITESLIIDFRKKMNDFEFGTDSFQFFKDSVSHVIN